MAEKDRPLMPAEMSILTGINTLRSIREFNSTPIPREKLEIILEAATKAASGSNTQPWEFIVILDPAVKRLLTEPMLRTWMERMRSTGTSGRMKDVYDDATEMLRNTDKAPAIVYCCLDLNRVSKSEEVRYASIYPAAQNLMLAAHALGIGSCLTVHGSTPTRGEPEVKKELGIPDHVKIACLIYLGHPARKHGPSKRKSVKQFTHYDKW